MRMLLMMLMGLLIAAPATASVYKDFAKAWEERDQTYRGEREALESRARSSAERAVNALVDSEPTAAEDLVLALSAAWSLSELVGRGQMLYALREHMAAKPSAVMSEIWIQGKADGLRRRQADTDMIEREMGILEGRDTIGVQQWIAALERLSMMRGAIAGEAAELSLISQNLATYYRARSDEQARSAELWAGVLAALAGAVQGQQEDIQRRSASCASGGRCGR